jgi:hypothetical protein
MRRALGLAGVLLAGLLVGCGSGRNVLPELEAVVGQLETAQTTGSRAGLDATLAAGYDFDGETREMVIARLLAEGPQLGSFQPFTLSDPARVQSVRRAVASSSQGRYGPQAGVVHTEADLSYDGPITQNAQQPHTHMWWSERRQQRAELLLLGGALRVTALRPLSRSIVYVLRGPTVYNGPAPETPRVTSLVAQAALPVRPAANVPVVGPPPLAGDDVQVVPGGTVALALTVAPQDGIDQVQAELTDRTHARRPMVVEPSGDGGRTFRANWTAPALPGRYVLRLAASIAAEDLEADRRVAIREVTVGCRVAP